MTTLLHLPPADRHTFWEDVVGLLVGTLLMALAVMVLKAGGLITGQIAGLSLLLSYASGWSFGAVFFVLNLPFYLLALRRMGVKFTIKTFAAVALLSGFTEVLPLGLSIEVLHPVLAALLFGVLAGLALIVLFRHGATLGGVGIVALWLQDKRGIPAGNTQLAFDAGVFALAFAMLPWPVVLTSLAGSVILNLMITVNHRGDRYIGRSG
ncbi:YitT family protein [Sagittula salina]|uniref:YitT family protein n=1 Tax=Sagittula salina TaxID=2820268 RepID=A0A940S0H7_9RHOB|nr:YitT family protein [Sagittula salina]MBP0482042.1 YitT family protein [Sagittula salina]